MRRSGVPAERVDAVNDAEPRRTGRFVLYWMTAARRLVHNFALQRAADWAKELGTSLVVVEGLRCGNRWDCDRFHRFILDGMADNAAYAEGRPVLYYPYVEPSPGAAEGLIPALADGACVVVTDAFPCFTQPALVRATAGRVRCRLEQVDSNGLLPLGATERVFPTAHSFRRFLQKTLRPHLKAFPKAYPLARVDLPALKELPRAITTRWPRASADLLAGKGTGLAGLPIDHRVRPTGLRGGRSAARRTLRAFLDHRLARYAADRNQPEEEVTSGLSPYLHHGHIAVHEVFMALMKREGWSADRLNPKATGSRSGWWGVGENAEAFLDELVTWREVGYNMAFLRSDEYDRYDSLPHWARATLADHADDPREYVYTPEQFEAAATHDPLWNAAQAQLVREGRVHNYLRMLWGKKIVEWSPTPETALRVMIHLNNTYALDGRNPNSYSGILWCLGRYDRPWGPERPVLGTVRYMSSDNTARKVRVKRYIARYAPGCPEATIP